MNRKNLSKSIAFFLSIVILLSSCSSTTLIQTNADTAELYLDGEKVGQTPYTMKDMKIVGTSTNVKLEKEGFETFNTTISKNEEPDIGAIVGGVFFLFPFLWTMKYKPTHTYELQPVQQLDNSNEKTSENATSLSKELRELKTLLEDGIITEEEYQAKKAKILNK